MSEGSYLKQLSSCRSNRFWPRSVWFLLPQICILWYGNHNFWHSVKNKKSLLQLKSGGQDELCEQLKVIRELQHSGTSLTRLRANFRSSSRLRRLDGPNSAWQFLLAQTGHPSSPINETFWRCPLCLAPFVLLRLTSKSGDRVLKLLATQTEQTRGGQVGRSLIQLCEYYESLAIALSAKSKWVSRCPVWYRGWMRIRLRSLPMNQS